MANEVATKETTTRKAGLCAALAERFEMEPGVFLDTIKKTVMPSTATAEEVAAFLMVAKEYSLNPILREIHAFPKKGGGISTVVGVDGWAKIITRHPQFDGVEFEVELDDSGKVPISITCILYRKDTGHPTRVTEYYSECNRGTEPWKQCPIRMLRHKALIQAGRIAFGLAGIMDEDEANDIREVAVNVVDDPLAPGRTTRRRRGLAGVAGDKAQADAGSAGGAITMEIPGLAPEGAEGGKKVVDLEGGEG